MGGMLENKVVVISGVGPALGTTLARRCAEEGADVVLAARTVERLEDVAKQVADLGRRAVAIGTDITDEGPRWTISSSRPWTRTARSTC